jgi:hypothetical protein
MEHKKDFSVVHFQYLNKDRKVKATYQQRSKVLAAETTFRSSSPETLSAPFRINISQKEGHTQPYPPFSLNSRKCIECKGNVRGMKVGQFVPHDL